MNGLKLLPIFFGFGLLLSGCGDPSVKLTDKSHLESFEDGLIYTVYDDHLDGYDDGGVFRGAVVQLGMNDQWMLAYVGRRVFKPDTDGYGWYALRLQDGKLFGPLDDQELTNNSEWNRIQTKEARTFFEPKRN